MTNYQRVMGVDASSATIGIAIVDYNDKKIKLVDLFHFKPPKKCNIFECMSKVRKEIEKIISKYKPDDISLEDIVFHMKNFSTAKTITTLAITNRTVGTAIFDKHGKSPYLYNVMRIRHAIKPTKTLPSKEDIPQITSDILGIPFPYIKDKNGKIIKKKNGDYKDENFDRADGLACALCHIYKVREGVADDLQIKKKKKKTRKSKK